MKKIIVFILLLAVCAAGWFFFFQDGLPYSNENCNKKFELLNARRRCEKDEPTKKKEYEIFKTDLLSQIDNWNEKGDTTHVTVYFRDLENGPIFGINEHERFIPASLLKTPIMISLLKYAETHPDILDETVSVESIDPAVQNVTDPKKTLVPFQTYTIREVLRRMIVYSDNVSKEMLYQRMQSISPDFIDQTFVDLGVSLKNPDGSNYITVKTYASLFRTLYNASYLNRDMSELALSLLSQVEFPDGIVAGLPKGMVVAHKFGFMDTGTSERQLHECGIVYSPSTPYLLCVMTRGADETKITNVIKQISKEVFQEVSSRD